MRRRGTRRVLTNGARTTKGWSMGGDTVTATAIWVTDGEYRCILVERTCRSHGSTCGVCDRSTRLKRRGGGGCDAAVVCAGFANGRNTGGRRLSDSHPVVSHEDSRRQGLSVCRVRPLSVSRLASASWLRTDRHLQPAPIPRAAAGKHKHAFLISSPPSCSKLLHLSQRPGKCSEVS